LLSEQIIVYYNTETLQEILANAHETRESL